VIQKNCTSRIGGRGAQNTSRLRAELISERSTLGPNPASNVKGKAGEETCVVSGMVTRVLDSAPLKNATVQLVSGEDREHTIATRTMSDGHFELRNVPSGRYRLKVSRDGYVEQEFGQKKPHRPWSDVRVEAESEDVRSDF